MKRCCARKANHGTGGPLMIKVVAALRSWKAIAATRGELVMAVQVQNSEFLSRHRQKKALICHFVHESVREDRNMMTYGNSSPIIRTLITPFRTGRNVLKTRSRKGRVDKLARSKITSWACSMSWTNASSAKGMQSFCWNLFPDLLTGHIISG